MITKFIRVSFFLLIATQVFSQNSDPLEFTFTTPTPVVQGGTFDVEVKVTNFDDLLSAQFAILWDSTVLRVDTIPFVTAALPDFNRSVISLPQDNATPVPGIAKVAWGFGLVAHSLPIEAHIFTLRFSVIGEPCDTTSLTLGPLGPFTFIEILRQDKPNQVGATSGDFPIMIPGTDCDQGGGGGGTETGCADDELSQTFGDVTADVGDIICMPLLVENFVDVATYQGTVIWDPEVLSFNEVRNINLPGAGASNFTIKQEDGTGTVAWFDGTGGSNTQTLNDGDALFEMCFEVIGEIGSSTTVIMGDVPTPIEITSNSGEYDVCNVSGTVQVGGIVVNDGFTIITNSVNSCNEETVCMDVTVDNFTDIILMQFTLKWDSTKMSYNRLENINSTLGLFPTSFNQEDDVLRLSWDNLNGFTLPNGTVLFTICFDLEDPSATDSYQVDIVDDITDIEIVKLGDEIVDYSINAGFIRNCSTPPTVTISSRDVTDVLCNGDSDGAISITIAGGTAPYTCDWGFTTETTNGGNCEQTGLSAGSYGVTITDSDNNTNTGSFTVNEPSEIVISGSTTRATSQTGGGTITYSYSGGTPGYSEEISPSVNINNAAPGTYTLLITDANDCTQTEVFTVQQPDISNPPVVVSVTGINSASCGNDGRICVTCTGGTGTFNNPRATPALTWDGNQGCFINVQGGRTYTITCTDTNGVSDEETVTVNVSAPTPLTGVATDIIDAECGLGGTFTIVPSGGCPGYGIQLSNDSVDPNQIFAYTPNTAYAPGNYTVYLVDAAGNEDQFSFNLPMSSPQPIAITTDVQSEASCTEAGTVVVNISGGCDTDCVICDADGNLFSCNEGNVVSFPAGDYTVKVTDSDGTEVTQPFRINQTGSTDPLDAEIVEITPAPCQDMDGGIVLNITGGCGTTTCTIDVGNAGTTEACNEVGGTILAPAGNHTITITDDVSGVFLQLLVNVPVDPDALTVGLDNIGGNSIDISPINGQVPYSYLWTYPDGSTINTEDISNLTIEGDYTVVVTDALGCTDSITIPWVDTEDPPPVLIINGTSPSDCGGQTQCNGSMNGTIQNGVAPYTLTLTDQFSTVTVFTVDNAGDFVLEDLCGGSYNVVLDDAEGVTFVNGSAVIVPSPEELVVTQDTVTCSNLGENNGSASVFVTGGSGGYIYTWNPSVANDGPSNDNLAIGSYLINVTDVMGCSAELALSVEDCAPTVDGCGEGISVITPNGDGRNEFFVVNCDDTGPKRIGIYDRWGREIFSSENYNNSWNGLDEDGQMLPEGAYHWVYAVNGQIYKGTVTLLRD